MNIFSRIATSPEKHFIGKHLTMSFAHNRTFQLWQSFMPRRQAIQNQLGTEFYSIEVYPANFYVSFNPEISFEKWAAIEVSELQPIPDGMEGLTIPAGMYAVFIHTGPASEGPKTYQYIFGTWLPSSGFVLDERPHFAVMGEKYKNNDPYSEEELWIPVRPR